MKTSEFPVGTVVDVKLDGFYGKVENGDWILISCVDCVRERIIDNDEIDQKDVTIISMPFGVVWQMAIMLADEYGDIDSEGELITFDGIIQDAVGEHNSTLDREAKMEKTDELA